MWNCALGLMSTLVRRIGPLDRGFQLYRYFRMSLSVGTHSKACPFNAPRNPAPAARINPKRNPSDRCCADRSPLMVGPLGKQDAAEDRRLASRALPKYRRVMSGKEPDGRSHVRIQDGRLSG